MTHRDSKVGCRSAEHLAKVRAPVEGRRFLFVHGLAASGPVFAGLASFWLEPTRSVYLNMPWSLPLDAGPAHEIWPLEYDNAQLLARAAAIICA